MVRLLSMLFFVVSSCFLTTHAQGMHAEPKEATCLQKVSSVVGRGLSCFKRASTAVVQGVIPPIVNPVAQAVVKLVKKYPQIPMTLAIETLTYLWLCENGKYWEYVKRYQDPSAFLSEVMSQACIFFPMQIVALIPWLIPMTAEQRQNRALENKRYREQEVQNCAEQLRVYQERLNALRA